MNKILLTLLASFIFLALPNFAKASCVQKVDENGKHIATECTDPNTKEVVTYEIEDGEYSKGAMKGCPPLASKLNEFARCNMCSMYKKIFNTANELLKKSFAALTIPLRNIMSVIFALLIAVKTISHVSSITANDGSGYVDDILKQTFKFFIAFVFLTFPNEVFYWIFNPVLKAGIEMGGAFLTNNDEMSENIKVLRDSGIAEYSADLNHLTDGLFSKDVYAQIEVFAMRVQQELAFMQAIGSSFMCISWNSAAKWIIIPDGSLLISGLTMYVFALSISIAYGFYLIDGILQLCLVGILTPFSLAAYPFNFSQKWMMTTWSTFLDTFFKFVFMGLTIAIIIEIMAFAVTGGSGGYDTILAAMNSDNSDTISSFFSITSVAFLTMCVCCIFASKMTKKATDLASTMSGGSMISAGSMIGAYAMQAITAPAKRVGKAAKDKVKGKIKKAGKKFANKVKSKANKNKDDNKNNNNTDNDNNNDNSNNDQGGDDDSNT